MWSLSLLIFFFKTSKFKPRWTHYPSSSISSNGQHLSLPFPTGAADHVSLGRRFVLLHLAPSSPKPIPLSLPLLSYPHPFPLRHFPSPLRRRALRPTLPPPPPEEDRAWFQRRWWAASPMRGRSLRCGGGGGRGGIVAEVLGRSAFACWICLWLWGRWRCWRRFSGCWVCWPWRWRWWWF